MCTWASFLLPAPTGLLEFLCIPGPFAKGFLLARNRNPSKKGGRKFTHLLWEPWLLTVGGGILESRAWKPKARLSDMWLHRGHNTLKRAGGLGWILGCGFSCGFRVVDFSVDFRRGVWGCGFWAVDFFVDLGMEPAVETYVGSGVRARGRTLPILR